MLETSMVRPRTTARAPLSALTIVTIAALIGIALRLDNPHGAPHSFDIDELNIHVPMAVGKSGLALFKPTKAGAYIFYCGVPGHRELGMEGKLIVEP